MSKKGFGKFLAGASLGAGLALLFAPKKGSETRQELKLSSYFKERTPADCKFLQNTLKIEHGFENR